MPKNIQSPRHVLGISGGKDSAALATVTFKMPYFQSFLTYTGEVIYQENDWFTVRYKNDDAVIVVSDISKNLIQF